ncbi:hypothetical protein BELL_0403g00100 [Botrytis elliptica]|uniref:Uncharacterized protein n=1 Tax=Botrytis elliptica TaxID=278938 RepID=A0A4Z1JVP4_9HELO|nr:hypothetical protein BELL_0403g00100 [Botrytis elliptica]
MYEIPRVIVATRRRRNDSDCQSRHKGAAPLGAVCDVEIRKTFPFSSPDNPNKDEIHETNTWRRKVKRKGPKGPI